MQIFCKLFKIQIPNYMYGYMCTSLTTVSGLVVQQNLQNCMGKWIIINKASATQSISQELQNRPGIFIEHRISSLYFNLVATWLQELKQSLVQSGDHSPWTDYFNIRAYSGTVNDY